MWWLWLTGLFLLVLIPLCWLPELSTSEASYALIGREMAASKDFLNMSLLGESTFVFPMSSWLLGLWSVVGPLVPFTIRLLGILPTALMALLCGWVTYRLAGVHAGAASGAAVFTMAVVAFQRGAIGEEHMLFSLFIVASWLVWYQFGRVRKRWFVAWALAHLLVCLAILTGGMKAIFLFYFPLFWLRRPIKIRRRLLQADHWLSLLLTIAVIAAWILFVPYMKDHFLSFFREFEPHHATRGYFYRFLRYPFRAVLGTLPWTFLLWPTYCEAFRPLEKQPIFSTFLRTVVSSLFFVFWLVPIGSTEQLIPLVGPVAILIGMNYDLLVRRYGPQLLLVVRVSAWATLAMGAATCILVVLSLGAVEQLPPILHMTAIVLCTAAMVLALVFLRWRPKLPIWMMVVVAVLMCKLMYSGSVTVFRYLTKDDVRRLTAKIVAALPPEEDHVYLLFKRNPGRFPVVWFNLGKTAQYIESADDQSLTDQQVVYVISEDRQPVAKNREWERLLTPKIQYHDKNEFQVWKGVLTEKVNRWEAASVMTRYLRSGVSSWSSERPGNVTLQQPSLDLQPRWIPRGLRGKPSVRFAGAQVLYREDADRVKEIGSEHTIVMVVKVTGDTPRQTLIDIVDGKDASSILVRAVYLKANRELSVFYRDKAGNYKEARRQVDLEAPTIVAIRRDSRSINLTFGTADGSSDTTVGHKLGEMDASLTYVTAVGATWNGKRFIDFLTGDIVELHIYNQALSDDRLHRVINPLRDTFLSEPRFAPE